MFTALLLTGCTAYFLSYFPSMIRNMFYTKIIFIDSYWLLIAIEIAVAIIIFSNVLRINVIIGYILLILYSILIGFIISPIFLIYEMNSIFLIFGYSSLLFFLFAFIGLIFNLDYSRIRSIIIPSLLTLIIANTLNLFIFKLEAIDWILSLIGIIIFSILIAYDTNKLNEINQRGNERTPQEHREVILGTLIMYLDFINVFLRMLRIFGKRK